MLQLLLWEKGEKLNANSLKFSESLLLHSIFKLDPEKYRAPIQADNEALEYHLCDRSPLEVCENFLKSAELLYKNQAFLSHFPGLMKTLLSFINQEIKQTEISIDDSDLNKAVSMMIKNMISMLNSELETPREEVNKITIGFDVFQSLIQELYYPSSPLP